MAYDHYRRLVFVLRTKCPPAYPVSVRRVKISKDKDGDCSLLNSKFYIRIDKNLPENSCIETLLHEWAHARAWNHLHDSMLWEEFEAVAHDASWGVAYSEVYRVYEQHFLSILADSGKCSKYRPR